MQEMRSESCTFAIYLCIVMVKIPIHKIPEEYQADMAFMRSFSEGEQVAAVDYAHRDEYFLLLFVERGTGKMLIDFKEYEIKGASVHCISPGQVHHPVGEIKADGWVLAVESTFIKNEYKDVFEKAPLINNSIELQDHEIEDLHHSASILHKKLKSGMQGIGRSVVPDLLSAYIGMVAEIYQRGFPVSSNNRYADITSRFKTLLSANYQSAKRPSQYASKLNISPVYLNEAVKKTTGLSTNDCIRDEIIIQAKRLLFYTKMSIKEIAQELGYDDWAYFTRFFTKSSSVSPSQFRKQYLE